MPNSSPFSLSYEDFNLTVTSLTEEKLSLLHRAKILETKTTPSYHDLIIMRKLCKEIVLVEEELREVEREFRKATTR